MSVINQKEYLKKYLGIGKGSGEKKKKKKSKHATGQGKGFKIVDDDLDVNLNEEIQVDLTGDIEDAPQIVSVIDERPPSLRVDEKTQNKLWKPLGAPEESDLEKNVAFEGSFKLPKNPGKYDKVLKKENFEGRSKKHRKSENSSLTSRTSRVIVEEHSSQSKPKRGQKDSQSPRRNREGSSDDNSPPRNRNDKSKDDISPRRRSRPSDKAILLLREIKQEKSEDNSPPRRSAQSEIDSSPPRKIKRERSEDISPPRKSRNIETDYSPPRRRRQKSEDISPPRRSRPSDHDSSPPRKIKREKSEDISPPRKSRLDSSPPRRKRDKSEDNSPPRRSRLSNNDSPPRKIKREKSEDMSPPRKSRYDRIDSPEPRRKDKRADNSPARKKKSRWADLDDENDKMQKTLDGKKAGLQNATDLVQETLALKKREDALFKNLSAEVSGANAATVVRSKKKEVDWEEEEKKRKKEEENKKKYDRWGKGLKQVKDVNEKIKSDLHEMSKPLARYADDEDLEKYLRDQEREGDPMLAYIRQKKKKKHIDEGKPIMQQYQGDAPPNRFGIWPGYRWDGVDRSCGYEKEWFQVQNSKKASLEETYKWSTEDM